MTPEPPPPHTQADAALASVPPLTAARDRAGLAALHATRRCQIMVTADFTDLGLEPAAFDKAVWAARAELQAELGRVFARPELGLGSPDGALLVQPCIEIEAAVRIYDPASEPRYIGIQAAPGEPATRGDVDVITPSSL